MVEHSITPEMIIQVHVNPKKCSISIRHKCLTEKCHFITEQVNKLTSFNVLFDPYSKSV